MGTKTPRQTIVFWLMTVTGIGVATGSYRFPVLCIDDAFRELSGETAVEPHPRIMNRSFAPTLAVVTIRP
ncbi:MAG: hypothetical protein CMQ61_03520 [Gammaproteobacteria bacterium]|nr:hypothetical protein [Gammaproteobacteria bacterium]